MKASLGGLIGQKIRERVAKTAYGKVDAYMTEKFPKGWDALCHAAKGWKTITAFLILYWDDIQRGILHTVQLMGFNPAPGVITEYAAKTLLVVALIDKAVKWWLAAEGLDKEEWEPPASPPEPIDDVELHKGGPPDGIG